MSLIYEALLLLTLLFAGSLVYLPVARALPFPLPRAAFQGYLVVLAGVYFVSQWTRGGQTLPMKTWHIRLASRDGARVSFRQALVRYVLALAGWLLCGAGYLWLFIDKDRQFLHDRLAGTRLVTADDDR